MTWGFGGVQIDEDKTYDNLGRLYQTYYPRYDSDPAYLASTNQYDLLNRVTEVDSLDESGLNPVKTTTQYQGFVTTLTNAKLQKRVDTRNVAGQLAQVQDANLGLTVFGHEPFGNLNSTKDPNDTSAFEALQQ
jgi:hypothetical protein